MIILKEEQLCDAAHYSGWNICLWGNPKMTIICGSCHGEFKTRSYYRFDREKGPEKTVANCPYCRKWNKMNIVLT